ncbi:hypothetical protein B0T25DRAFT_570303 [Lasiosphaeria hispida]|uniref:Uncharacterized protein n=1 Tax=Lasiosphaeria hispida TaxID=260671 RepID=A0AAJ0MCK6_9PEZI|nr:hypothetical protein B0T25DRAFT_570303 [Lasiosphaeria hispida]
MDLPAPEVLQLLRTHWEFYRKWIVMAGSQTRKSRGQANNDYATGKTPWDRIKVAFSSMMVPCRGGSSVPLRETYLPRKDVLAAISLVPKPEPALQAVHVPDPDSADWDMLQNFGVIREFQEKQLVLIPGQAGQAATWVGLNDCLAPGYATLRTLVEEAKRITTKDSLEYIRRIFKQTNFFMHGLS